MESDVGGSEYDDGNVVELNEGKEGDPSVSFLMCIILNAVLQQTPKVCERGLNSVTVKVSPAEPIITNCRAARMLKL